MADVVKMLEETRLRLSVISHYGMWGCRGGDYRQYQAIISFDWLFKFSNNFRSNIVTLPERHFEDFKNDL